MELLGCVGHARYGIPKLEERSASASQVRMRREYKMGNCAYGPTGAARCDDFEYSTSDECKGVNNWAQEQNRD
eukprot:1331743-Pleurochrysis_carterae.AAC.5